MSKYRTLRFLRIILFGAFVISLGVATAWKDDVSIVSSIAIYLPVSLLVLALIAGLVERLHRIKQGIAPIRWVAASSWVKICSAAVFFSRSLGRSGIVAFAPAVILKWCASLDDDRG